MDNRDDLLFELGTEELPPKSLPVFCQSLRSNMEQALNQAELEYDKLHVYATPRRLAILINGLATAQADKTTERKGPAMAAAFDANGHPTKAAEGFARGCGVPVDQLQTLATSKGECLCFRQQLKGEHIDTLIPGIITECLEKLPIAKRMHWGSSDIEFVRPVHWSVLLFGTRLISAQILGTSTQAYSYGHRFLAPHRINFDNASQYLQQLATSGKVLVDFETRKQKIHALATAAAEKVNGIAIIDPQLLNEITALVEWPVAITGEFDKRYLKLPPEVLVTTMQSNQKYFPVETSDKQLLAFFITISNIESNDPNTVVKGNERVIRPRLADADFFWKQDRKLALEKRIPLLEKIVFQKQLGTLADKSRRVKSLCIHIAKQLQCNESYAKRAALLAKTDLVTDMVGEFPSLQGTIGRYYALADNEPDEVAIALEEQYLPKHSGGKLPETQTGQILSLADKIDTLAGIFSAGLIPTGDKDPYALRRAALGTIRIIVEKQLDLDLSTLLDTALAELPTKLDAEKNHNEVYAFVIERFRGYCLEKHYKHDEFEAVLAINTMRPIDFEQRLIAVKHFRTLAESESLAAANKRIKNILRKAKVTPHIEINHTHLQETEEKELLDAADSAAQEIVPFLQKRDYTATLSRLALLREPVDNFFDKVMVMCDDPDTRANRLALLFRIESMFLGIADLSKLQ